MALAKEQIVKELRSLGVEQGAIVMAHVALSAFGEVEGGADTVIAALAEALGETGTLCMPAMSGDKPFNVETSPSNVGAVAERFRSWPGVTRSIHPTHSICCLGPEAEELIRGHIEQPTALGPESPWGRIISKPNGYVLLMGCDQDRNTLLHCAEEIVAPPYLKPIERDYLNEDGAARTKVLEKFPGPHRDFIGMDRLLREGGAMRTGKIGKAVCRLMHAGKAIELAVAALREDPAAVLCDNPNCADCVKQRAAITRHRLSQEDFTLTAVVDEIGLPFDELQAALDVLQGQGIDAIEFGPDFTSALFDLTETELADIARSIATRGMQVWTVSCPGDCAPGERARHSATISQAFRAKLAKLSPLPAGMSAEAFRELIAQAVAEGLTPAIENAEGTPPDTKENCETMLAAVPELRLIFNPAHFAHVGEKPFLHTFYKGKLKHAVVQLYITDGCRPGGEPYTLPGRGQGEVKELMSILRCRSFAGAFCLKMGDRTGKGEFVRQCEAFWRLMDGL